MSDMHNLQDLITRESNDLQVISVWESTGGGDLGATSIFRKAYCDRKIVQDFKIRVWIKLMRPFNREEFLKSLMVQLCTSSHQATVGTTDDFRTRMKAAAAVTQDDLIKAEQLMKGNRYLVVLEQVSTLVEWDAIKIYLPDCKNGSRIVVSAHDLGVALMCTGEPYQVSQLRHFSHGQAICAFFKTVSSSRRRDRDELKWLIRQGGVIAVHGRTRRKLNIVKELYRCIKYDVDGQYYDFGFEIYRWVNVSNPLNRMKFPRSLPVDSDESADDDSDDNDSDGLQASEVVAVELELIKDCCKTLRERNCLVVIDGLRSAEDWDWIKATFLSQPIKGCIVVITNEERVAKHCVDDEEDRAINSEYLEPKGCRKEEARGWTSNFGVPEELPLRKRHLTAVWGIAGIGKSDFVRNTYYNRILGYFDSEYVGEDYSYYSWVDVPHPFNLTEFSWRLLLDFYSDDLQAKEAAAISIIEGQDPIQVCHNILSENCLVVIDGLQSKDEWDLIKAASLYGNSRSSTVVITNEVGVASYCVCNNDESVVNVKGLEADEALSLFKKSYFEDCKDSLKPCIFYLPVFPTNRNIRRRRLLRRWIAEGYSRDTSSGTAEENGERLFSELVDLSIIQQPSSKSMCRVNGFFHEYIISRPMEDNLFFALEGHCSMNSQLGGQHLAIRKSWDRDINVFESIDFSSLRSFTVFGEWRPFFISTNINMKLLRVLDLEDMSNVTDDDVEHIGKLLPRLKFLSLRGHKGINHLPDSFRHLRQLQTLDVRHTSIATLQQAIIKMQKLQYIRAGTSKKPWNEGGRVISLPAPDDDRTSTSSEEDDIDTLPSQHPPPPAATQTEEGAEIGSSQPAAPALVWTSTPSRSRPHTLLSSWFSKLCCTTRQLNSRGVEVPEGIGKLTALHTLGVVDVGGVGGKAILMELKNLSQLRRLGLCGINGANLKELCSAISGHNHLESLSVQVIKNKEQGVFCCFDDTISPPPKNLKSLKLDGYAHIKPGSWMKQLDNLEMLDLEMTILRQEDIHVLDELPRGRALRRLCVKLTQEGELQFTTPQDRHEYGLQVLEIDCASKLHVTFFHVWLTMSVKVLKVHCSSGSSLRLFGLEHLDALKEVWLKGSCGDELKQDMQQQLSKHKKKPVLKLVCSPDS